MALNKTDWHARLKYFEKTPAFDDFISAAQHFDSGLTDEILLCENINYKYLDELMDYMSVKIEVSSNLFSDVCFLIISGSSSQYCCSKNEQYKLINKSLYIYPYSTVNKLFSCVIENHIDFIDDDNINYIIEQQKLLNCSFNDVLTILIKSKNLENIIGGFLCK